MKPLYLSNAVANAFLRVVRPLINFRIKLYIGIVLLSLASLQANGQGPATALNFDGVSDYVDLGTSSVLKPTTELTVELWAQKDNWNQSSTMIGNTQSSGYAIYNNATDLIGLVRRNGSYAVVSYPTANLTNGWHHYALTYDGQTTKLIIDGTEVDSDNANGTFSISYIGNNTLIGAEAGGVGDNPTGLWFDGSIDEVRIWNDARTQSEIQANRLIGLNGQESNLLAYYNFNNGVVGANNAGLTTLDDLTANNNDGTLVSFSLNGTQSNWSDGSGNGVVDPDTTAPTVITQNVTVQLDANGNASVTPEQVNNGSSDNSGGALTLSLDKSTFDCNDLSSTCNSGSLRIDGNNDEIILPNKIALGSSFTLEYWVKNNGSDNTYDRITTTSPLYTFETAKNGAGVLSIYGLGRGWITTGVSISSTQYDHIAWVFDGSTVRLYKNGTEAWSDSGFSADTRLADWSIGNFVDAANFSIDEARLWNSARTAQQINSNASPCAAIDTQGLVFRFSFDEGSGNTATESVSGAAIAMVGGVPIWENDHVQTSTGVPVTLTVTDPFGNSASSTATVTVEDNIAPTVNLNGDAVVNLNLGDTFTETASAADNCSATLDIQGTVNSAVAGTYILTYKATDGSGNESVEVTRTVTVINPVNALNFDGINDRVDLGNSAALRMAGGTNLTLEAWVNYQATGGQQLIFTKFIDFQNAYAMDIGAAGNVTFAIHPGAWKFVTSTTALSPGQWYHIAGTYDGEKLRVYINGVEDASVNETGAIPDSPTTNLYLGYVSNNTAFFKGSMDEARVWNVTRSCAEIYATKDVELTGNEPGLVAYYNFNNGSAGGNNSGITNLEDQTANNHDGTLVGFDLNGSTSNWVDASANGVTNGAPGTFPEINVTGNGQNIASGDVTPDTADDTDFGALNLSGNDVHSFTIQNSGTGNLNISSIVVSGANSSEFVVSNTPTSIAAGASGSFDLTFTPGALGTSSATITINNDDCDEGVYSFNVQGAAADNVAPTIIPENVTVSLDANGNFSLDSDNLLEVVSAEDQSNNNQQPITAASFSSPSSGTLNGVPFTITNVVQYSVLNNFDLSVSEFGPAPLSSSQQTVEVSSNENWTITFNSPIQSLKLYTRYWRDLDLEFDQPFEIISGNNITKSGNVLSTSVFGDGIVQFTNPVTTLSATVVGRGANARQAMTFADGPVLSAQNGPVFLGTVSDDSGIASITASKYDFNCQDIGSNQVTLTATDNAGNVAQASVSITIEDKTKPVFTAYENLEVSLGTDGTLDFDLTQLIDGFTGTTDFGFSFPQNTTAFTIGSVSDNCQIQSISVDNRSFTCNNIGTNFINVYVYDAHGNNTTETVEILVKDDTAPVVTTEDVTVTLDANGNYSLDSDNLLTVEGGPTEINIGTTLDPAVVSQIAPAAFSSPSSGTLNGVAYTISNVVQHSVLNNFDLSIDAFAAPLSGSQQTVELSSNENFVITFASPIQSLKLYARYWRDVDVEFDQPFRIISGRNMASQGNVLSTDTFGDGIIEFTNPVTELRATVVGRGSNGRQVLTFADGPVLADLVGGGGTVTLGTVAENCGIASITASQYDFSCQDVGVNAITITVTDNNGNQTQETVNVTVREDVAPVIVQADPIEIESGDAFTPATINATDNCGSIAAQVISNNVNTAVAGSYEVQYQATDASGNQSNVMTQTVNVIISDAIPPTVNVNSNVTVYLDQNGQATLSVNDVDNGSVDNESGIATRTLDRENFTCSDIQVGASGPTTQLVYQTTSTTGNQDFGGSLGMEFDVSSPIVVNSLGAFDHNSDGIANAIRVYIINRNTGLPVPGLNVLISGATDPLINNHRVRTVSPVTLPVGNYMIVAKGFNAVDLNGNDQDRSFYQTDDNNGAIQFVGISPFGYNFDLNVFDVPNVQQGSIPNYFLAGTFGYQQNAAANTQLVYQTTSNTGNQDFGGTLGMEFNVSTPVTVNSLGAFDHNSDGIANAIRVYIIDKNTGVPVPGLNVLISGATDPLINNHRVRTVNPVTLPAGNYMIVAKGFNAVDLNGNDQNRSLYQTDDNNGAIQFVGISPFGYNFDLNVFDVPNVQQGSISNLFLAGTFGYEVSNSGTIQVTLTVTDDAGNSASETANVTVLDNIAPSIAQADAIEVDFGTVFTPAAITATDNCGTITAGVISNNVNTSAVGTYQVQYRATDASGNESNVMTQSVTVIDVVAPVFTSVTAVNFAENTTGTVYTIIATDDNAITYSLGSGNDEAAFDLNGAVLTFKSAPDFETKSSYVVNVVATDALGNAANQDVTVTILDVDDEAPVFTSSTTASVNENTSGTVYTAVATDENAITYGLGSGNDEADFDLVGAALSFKSAPDFEIKASYVVNIIATDALGNASNQNVTITILDVDEIAPVITSATAINFTENTSGTVYTITATDDNAISYGLGAGNDEAAFNLNGADLSFKSSPDFETKASYTVNVVATDALGNSSNQNVTVTILDVDEIAPVFTSATSASFTENTAGTVYTIAATDDNAIAYSLGAGNDEAAFDLNGAVLTFKTSPDFELKSSYVVNVVATDALGNAADQDVTISIIDVDENPPVFISAIAVDFTENTAGTVYTIATTDESAVTYGLGIGNDEADFDLNGAVLTFKASPDFEAKSSYTVNVVATDALGNTANQDVTVTILDVDDEAPVFTSSTALSVDENTSGTVYTAAATDDNVITYSLGSGNDEAAFDLVGAALSFKSTPDFETKASYVVNIVATDALGYSSNQDVTITILDVDEIAPVITSAHVVNFEENSANTAYTITATDDNAITYGLGSGNDEAAFDLNGADLTFKASPDFETKSSYTVNVVATDALGNVANQDVIITILDVDEIAPVITSATTASFTENTTGTVYTIVATDDSAITYSLGSGNDEADFDLNGAVLTFKSSPDFEAKSSYTVNVVATDALGNSANQDVTVTILDVDDEAPIFTSGITASFTENTSGTVYTIAATDENTITYSLGSGNDEGDFDLNGADLAFKTSPDFETKATFVVNVVATDALGNTASQDVTVSILDVDENPPVFTSGTTVSFTENATGTAYTIAATDESALTYSLGSGNDSGAFDLNGAIVTFKSSPDFETKASYLLNVVATDALGNSTDQDVTINILDVDDTPPTVTLTHYFSTYADDLKGYSSIKNQTFTVSLSEAVERDLVVSDFFLTRGYISSLVKNANGTYTANFVSTSDGTANIQFKAGVLDDLAGNGNLASNLLEILFDARRSWPHSIIIDEENYGVQEKESKWRLVGKLKAIDPADPHDYYRYYLSYYGPGGTDNSKFYIHQGALYKRQGVVFDRSVQTTASVSIRAYDQTNRWVEKVISIPITEKTTSSSYFHITIDDAYSQQEFRHNAWANYLLSKRQSEWEKLDNPDTDKFYVDYTGYLLPFQAFAGQDIYRKVRIKNMMDFEGDIDGFYYGVYQRGSNATVQVVDIVDGNGNKYEEMPATLPANGELVVTLLYDANTYNAGWKPGYVQLYSGASKFNLDVWFLPARINTTPYSYQSTRRFSLGGHKYYRGDYFYLYANDNENDAFDFVIVKQPNTGSVSVSSRASGYSGGYKRFIANFYSSTRPTRWTNDSFQYQLKERGTGNLSPVYTYYFNYYVYDEPHTLPRYAQDIDDGAFKVGIEDQFVNDHGYYVKVWEWNYSTRRYEILAQRSFATSSLERDKNIMFASLKPSEADAQRLRGRWVPVVYEVWGGWYKRSYYGWEYFDGDGNLQQVETSDLSGLFVTGSDNSYPENEEGEFILSALDSRRINLSDANIEITQLPHHGTISSPELITNEEGIAQWSVKYNANVEGALKDSVQFTVTHPQSEGEFTAYATIEIVGTPVDLELEEIDDVQSQEDEIVYVDYTATQGESALTFAVEVSDENVVAEIVNNQIKLTPAADFSGNVLVELTATETDGENPATVSQSFNLEILEVNDRPVVAPIANQVVDEDGSLEIAVSATDTEQEDDFLSLNFSTNADDKIDIQISENGILFKPVENFYGDISISVTADDHTGTSTAISVPETFVLTVNPVNDPPVITNEVPFQSLVEGFADYTLDLSNFFNDIDTEQEDLTYSIEDIPNVSTNIDGHVMTISSVAGANGTFAGALTVNDGEFTESQIVVFTVAPASDDIIVVNPLDDLNLLEDFGEARIDMSNVFANTADPNAEFFFTVSGNQNISVTVDGTELVLTTEEHYFGSESLVVTATAEGVANSEDFMVNIAPVNDAPELVAAINDQNATEDEVFGLVYPASSFTDVDGDALSYSAAFNAAWLAFDATSRAFTGIPMNGDVGQVTVMITATDPSGASVSDEFVISVINTNDEPTDISLSRSEILENNAIGTAIGSFSTTDPDASKVNFTYDLVSGAGDTDNANFTIEGGVLVAASTFDFETKTSYSIRVRTRDEFEGSFEKVMTISILDEDERPPVFDSAPVTEVDETAQYRYPILVSSPGGLDFSVALAAEVDWLSLVQEDGYTAVLVGDPAGRLGETDVEIIATDQYGATTSQSFTINVKDVTAPTVVGRNLSFHVKPGDEINLTVEDLLVSVTDNAVVVDTTISKSVFTGEDHGINEVTITATDDSGNEGTTIVTVEIINISTDEDNDGIPGFMDKYPFDPTNGGKPAIITYVWDDEDGDGRQDSDEPGITDILVKLKKSNGKVLQQGRTNQYNGMIAFFDLDVNEKVKLSVEKPSDSYAFTHKHRGGRTQNSDVDRRSGETTTFKLYGAQVVSNYDAGMWSPGQVETFVWDDLDGDGRQDSNEPGIENVLVKLRKSNGKVIGEARTNADGIAVLADAPADQNLKVSFDKPNSGYAFTHRYRASRDKNSDADRYSGYSGHFKLTRGNQTYTNADAGMWSPGQVEAFVWDDLDGDGRQDLNEPGIENVLVKLRKSNGNVLVFAQTNANGIVRLPNAPADQSLKLSFELPNSNYAFTHRYRGQRSNNSDADRYSGYSGTFKLTRGNQTYTNADAGMWSPGQVETFVWDDLDGDGRQDANEPGLRNVVVKLRKSNGKVIGQAITNGNGIALFENAPADQAVKLSFEKPSDSFAFTHKHRGQRSKNSDADRNSGQTSAFKLTAGNQTYSNADAGLWSPGTVETYVWNDVDRDGKQDSDESGLSDVLVKLRKSNGKVISEARTDANGIARLRSAPANQNLHITVEKVGRYWEFSPSSRGYRGTNSDVDRSGKSGNFKLTRGDQLVENIDAGQYERKAFDQKKKSKRRDISDELILNVEGQPAITLAASPNPATSIARIVFMSEVGGTVKVGVVNHNGVRLQTLFEGELEAGEQKVVEYDVSGLASGVYIIRLVTAGEAKNVKLIVRH